MGAFQIIDLCDKMTDAISHLGDVLIVIDVNFFLFEGWDKSFSIPFSQGCPRFRLYTRG